MAGATLYFELGGISAMRKTAQTLRELLCRVPALEKRTKSFDCKELTTRLEAVLTFTFGGSPYYEGQSLRTDFRDLLVSDEDFDLFCGLVPVALDAISATRAAKEEAQFSIEQMRDFMLNKPVAQTA